MRVYKWAGVGAIILIMTIACRDKTHAIVANERVRGQGLSSQAAPSPQIVQRDLHIDSTNAYSDLFMDSAKLEAFLSKQPIDDSLARSFRNFYNSRNFQFAWFSRDGFTEQALAFSSLYNYSKDSGTARKWLDSKLDSLQNLDTLTVTDQDPGILRTELLMTWRFINYLGDRYRDEKERTEALVGFVPARKRTLAQLSEDLLASPLNADKSTSPWFHALVSQLKKYMAMPPSPSTVPLTRPHKKYKQGESHPYIVSLKKALREAGALSTTRDTSGTYNLSLREDIRSFQATHGLEPDGRIQPSLIEALNVPREVRIKQLLVNIERMLWMPSDSAGSLIVVNIPEFRLHVLDTFHPVFDMNVVVGKEGHSTVLFSGKLDRIEFNPYWNVPPSIVKTEILPGMKMHRHYLKEHDMEITGKLEGLPVIRQKPGPKNELGAMKFLFPNSFNIYFHDTPHKDLFKLNQRAFSHGCIRLADPVKLAMYLLRDSPDWTKQKLDNILAVKKERGVKVPQPPPVLICYFTVWVQEGSRLQFRKDIYGHDTRVEKMLFAE